MPVRISTIKNNHNTTAAVTLDDLVPPETALLHLAEAIRQDNAEAPQPRNHDG
jgi:hypothetical protein